MVNPSHRQTARSTILRFPSDVQHQNEEYSYQYRFLTPITPSHPTPAVGSCGTDALMIRRALSEPFGFAQDRPGELVRAPSGVRPIFIRRTGRQWFWALLPKQKRVGGRDETRHASNEASIHDPPHGATDSIPVESQEKKRCKVKQ